MKQKNCSWEGWRLFFCCCFLLLWDIGVYAQQTSQLKGQVIDAANNEPLIGVSIQEKGTTNGVVTDMDGNFVITVSPKATLVFSYIGYETLERKASECHGVIKLKEDSQTLQEVVVVGYGMQKKVNLSGSVSAIEGDKIAAKPSTDVLSALQGELPGVTVLRRGGQPGSETSGMRIRGFSSVNSTSTLVLIDGVEGDLTLVNPNDIASISVLKDAASCAIYGARAAAGVVLVTTKAGTEGKPKISYNGSFTFHTPGNMPERLPAWEEQAFIDQSRLNYDGKREWSEEKASWVGNPNFNTRPLSNGRWDYFDAINWVEEGTRDFTTQQTHSLSVSGGNKTTNYMFSANYYTKNGLLKYGPDSNERYNLHAKVKTEFNKYFEFSLNAQYQSRNIEAPSYGAGGIFNSLFTTRGRQSVFVPEGDESGSIYNGDLQGNPIDIMKNGGIRERKLENYIGKATLGIKDVVKNLRIDLSASRRAGYYAEVMEKHHLEWRTRDGKTIRNQVNNPDELYKCRYSNYHDLLEATANYTFDLNGKHNFSLLAGSSYENYRQDQIDATAKSLNSDDFFSFNGYDSSIATNTELSDKIDPWSMMSYFGRINYNYRERYLFEANIRYDGSSRLAPGKRWKAFPSVSAAWRVNEEKWFKADFISQLKLRASWGELGNGAVLGLYDYMPLIKREDYMGEGAYFQEKLASTDKTWEVVSTTNIGMDFGLFNNRLSGSFEYYWKVNDNMLASPQVPHQIGIKVPNLNIGKLKTWGWDLNVTWKDRIKDFNYQIGFNISDSKNELVEYNGVSVVKAGIVQHLQGYELNTIWGYKTDGYWSSREEYLQYKKDNPGYKSFNDGKVSGGDIRYVSQGKADHEIGVGSGTLSDTGDLVYLGNTDPRYLYGLNLSAQWRGFDISVMFQGVGKRKAMVQFGAIAPLSGTGSMPWTIHRDYWTEDNQDAYWPRLCNYANNDFNFKTSDKWIQNAAYIRLKNVTVGYTLPIPKKYVERVRVYVTGEDIWEHTKMLSVFDPEQDNGKDGINRSFYPFFRSWTVGLNVSF